MGPNLGAIRDSFTSPERPFVHGMGLSFSDARDLTRGSGYHDSSFSSFSDPGSPDRVIRTQRDTDRMLAEGKYWMMIVEGSQKTGNPVGDSILMVVIRDLINRVVDAVKTSS